MTQQETALAWFHARNGRTEADAVDLEVWTAVGHADWYGEPWCAAAVTAAYLEAGIDLRPLCTDNNSFYVPYIKQMAMQLGAWKTSNNNYGDLAIYGNSGVPSHIGISEPGPDPEFWAWEGNTTNPATGQGPDGVFLKGRDRSWIQGWVDMAIIIAHVSPQTEPMPEPTPEPPAPQPSAPTFPLGNDSWYGAGGSLSGDGLRQWQQRMAERGWGIAMDGVYGPQTRMIATQFQREKGLVVDGLIGPQTWNAAWEAPVT